MDGLCQVLAGSGLDVVIFLPLMGASLLFAWFFGGFLAPKVLDWDRERIPVTPSRQWAEDYNNVEEARL